METSNAQTAVSRPAKIRIGDLLVKQGVISPQQLDQALKQQKESGRKLGSVLIEIGAVEEEKLLQFLAKQLNIQYIDLKQYRLDSDAVHGLPEASARRLQAIVLENAAGHALVGMADPTDIFSFDELAKILKKPVKIAVVKEKDMQTCFDRYYQNKNELRDLAAELEQELPSINDIGFSNESSLITTPAVKLLNSIFDDAVRAGASDVHFEQSEKELRIRLRVDGSLRVQTTIDRRVANALLSRLKLMSGLDISEKRLPQDGRFHVELRNKKIDMRVSTMPTQYGETAVLRLLDLSAGIVKLDRLGMPSYLLPRIESLLQHPFGLILITGPTGSGKTTTLYSMLSRLNQPDVKIITVEDPVEYRLEGINQVQVNSKINLDFTRVLRAMLRQDPDIALIGEIRDRETVDIALRTAMTGHLVLSSLHTNNAISTTMRLMDMGAEPYLIASALKGILAQRLVKRICEHCKSEHSVDPVQLQWLRREYRIRRDPVFYKGQGCSFCNHTGYRGRIGVYEFLEMTTTLANSLLDGQISRFAEVCQQQENFQPIKLSALQLVIDGQTSFDEFLKVTYGMDI